MAILKLLSFIFGMLFLVFPFQIIAKNPAPVNFWLNEEREIFGTLEDGSEFSQINIFLEPRIQKFNWENGSWYVSDKGIIEAKTDLEALSIYFSI